MIKENIPPVEEVRGLESELTGLTPEQKKANQEYILSNLDQYIIDTHGNFFHTDEDMMINEDQKFYIGREAVEDYDKVKERIAEMIIREKDSWEITSEGNYRKKNQSGKIMFSAGFSSEQNERIKRVLEGVLLEPIQIAISTSRSVFQQRGRMGRNQNASFVIATPTLESVQEATRLLNERLNGNGE